MRRKLWNLGALLALLALGATPGEIDALVAFLGTLTDA
jgi:hypothetical protein